MCGTYDMSVSFTVHYVIERSESTLAMVMSHCRVIIIIIIISKTCTVTESDFTSYLWSAESGAAKYSFSKFEINPEPIAIGDKLTWSISIIPNAAHQRRLLLRRDVEHDLEQGRRATNPRRELLGISPELLWLTT